MVEAEGGLPGLESFPLELGKNTEPETEENQANPAPENPLFRELGLTHKAHDRCSK